MPSSDFIAFAGALVAASAGVVVASILRRSVGGRWRPWVARLADCGPVTCLGLAAPLALGLRDGWLPAAVARPASAITYALFVGVASLAAQAGTLPRWGRGLVILWLGYLVAGDVSINAVKIPFSPQLADLGVLAPFITALWLLLFSVLFGRAATIPGVPAGVATAAGLTFWAICRLRPDLTGPEGALFAALLAGACLPQLMGARRMASDSTAGGYVIGFLVGVASLTGALKNTALLIAAVPLLVVGAPLFAAVYHYAADLRSGWRAVAVADRRRHLHEVLLEQGYRPRQVLALIMAGTVYLCLVALGLVALIEVSFVLKLLLIAVAAAAGLAFFYVVLRMMRRPLPAGEGGHPEPVDLMGVRLDPVTMPQAMAEAERFIREDRPHMIVTTDATGFMKAQDDPEFRSIVNQADLVTPDGAGVVLAARLLNIPLAARCSGCDMVSALCGVAARLDRPVFLLGAGPGVAEKAAENLCEQNPGLRIAGCQDGFFTEEQEPEIVARIRQAHPGVLFVALGIPRQEKWIRGHLEELGVPICVGIGGSFDVISGLKKRAPVWMQRTGLEWLYRVWKEPWRLPRLAALPRIVLMAFAELLRPPGRMPEERK